MYKYNDPSLKNIRQKLRRESTKSERVLWSCLSGGKLGYKFRRQYGVGKFILDFYCPELRLCIEIDGITHEDESQFDKDFLRESYIKSQGIKVLRFTSKEVFLSLNDVINSIRLELTKSVQ